ncbi:MAG: hypothetical protein KC609_17045 [Myxococcales bacterium]|nr:hypothetical protein [Myxococcales bacterium]
MTLQFATRNDAIIAGYVPFLVATPQNRPYFDTAPFGLSIAEREIIDPMRLESKTFLHLLQRLDQLTFGPEGMPMPLWIFYDCSELPGGIFGFGRYADALDATLLAEYGVPAEYHGLVPFSMYIAIPMSRPGDWMGHNLASLSPTFPELGLRGLGAITKALALKVYRVEQFYGVTQWESKALYIHTKFGPLGLTTAFTPAHSTPHSLTYSHAVDEACIRAACGDPTVTLDYPPAELYLDSLDEKGMIELQEQIEAGERFAIVGPPERYENGVRHPIARR